MVCRHSDYASDVCVVSTDEGDIDSFVAAIRARAEAINAGFALVFFSLSCFDGTEIRDALKAGLDGLSFAGCSTAGEITPLGVSNGGALAILLPKDRFQVSYKTIEPLASCGLDGIAGKASILRNRHMMQNPSRACFAISLIDGMSTLEEIVVSALQWGLNDIPLVGGSAGDDLKFASTTLITEDFVGGDAAILILVETDVPFYLFKTDNFVATDERLVVTSSDPDRRVVHEFNADSASREYAAAIGLEAKQLDEQSFASHPVVVKVGGEYYCRSIQRANEDGSLSFLCAVDDGIVLSVAHPTNMVDATRLAFDDAQERLGAIDFILGFDCFLRRVDAENRQITRMMSELYSERGVIGFGTYGEHYCSMHLNQTFIGIAFGKPPARQ